MVYDPFEFSVLAVESSHAPSQPKVELSDEHREMLGSAIEAAVRMCHELDIELVVPSVFVMDVLLNSCAVPEIVRLEFRDWVGAKIDTLPNLDLHQRDLLRRVALLPHGSALDRKTQGL